MKSTLTVLPIDDHSPALPSSAAQGSLAQLASFVITAGLNYCLAVLMSWLLPVDQYGMLGVLQAFLILAGTAVNAGFPWALAQSIPRERSYQHRARLFGGALIGNGLVGAGLALILVASTETHWLGLSAQYQGLVLVAGATVLIMALSAALAAALQGLLRLTELAIVRAAETLIKFVGATVLVLLGAGTLGAITGFFLGAIAAAGLAGAMLRGSRLYSTRDWDLRAASAGAAPFFLGMFSLAVMVNADIIGLEILGPSGTLTGYYQAAVTVARIPVFLVISLLNAVFPFVALHASRSGLTDVYAKLAVKYTLLFIVPVDIMLMVIPGPILRILFAPAFQASAPALAVAAFGTILLSLAYLAAMLLQAAGRLWIAALATGGAAILELAALNWLVPQYGMVGAALGVVVGGGGLVVVLGPVAVRTFGLLPSPRPVVGYGAALAAFAGGLAVVVSPDMGRLPTAVAVVALGCVYIALLIVFGVLTRRDVQILGDGLGPRWAGLVRVLGAGVERLNVDRTGLRT